MVEFSGTFNDMLFLHDVEGFSYDCGIIVHQYCNFNFCCS